MEKIEGDNTLNSTEGTKQETVEDKKTAKFLFTLHDIGNAERFVQQHGENLR